MSKNDKACVDRITNNTITGTIEDYNTGILTKTPNGIEWQQLPQSVFDSVIQYNPTSISLDTNWKATGFILSDTNGFQSGSYVIKIISGNLIFSGTASVYVGKITTDDEILLHISGIPQKYSDGTQGRIYAKIAPSQIADYGELYLATNVPQSAITNLSITMKKLI